MISPVPIDSITCFTDGSRTDTGCRVDYIITTNNNNNNNTTICETSYKLPDYCTVFQAELTAIREACNYLANTSNKHIIVWTDSLSSIKAVTTLSIKSRTIRNCYEDLNTLRTNSKQLTPAYGVTREQTRWLSLALHSSSNTILYCPIPHSYIKKLIYENNHL
jgi:ribonuclease HI